MDYSELADASEKHVEKLGGRNELLYSIRSMCQAINHQPTPEERAKIRKLSTVSWRDLYEPFTI
jgi:hypothetical protein